MNKVSLKKDSLLDYDLYIFDLDGTLYFQKPFRVRMALYLACHVLTHPMAIRDIFLIKKYREVREHWEACEKDAKGVLLEDNLSLNEKQYAYVAMCKGVEAKKVEAAVDFFMMKAPLSLLPAYADTKVRDFIKALQKDGKKVAVYSDYPVEDKLRALQIEVPYKYTSEDEAIGTMKPDPKGIEVILADLQVAAANAVMVGDRYEKDGMAAESNNVDYLILSSKKLKREDMYRIFER